MPKPCATASRASSTTMTPADAAPSERRLHPWSWLFVLLQQLRQFIIPIVAAFFFGGDRNELWPLIGVGVLTLTSVLQYLTYRYTVGRDGLSIRSGWLHRQRREIPYARIHNVSVNQTVLHRMFGVAELRLDSAGGEKPEATMRVLRMDDALALERLIRHRGATVEATADGEAPTAHVLLAMSPARSDAPRLHLQPRPARVARRLRRVGAIRAAPGGKPVRNLGQVDVRLGRIASLRRAGIRDRRRDARARVAGLHALAVARAGAAAVLRLRAERRRPAAHGGTRAARAFAQLRVEAPPAGVDACRKACCIACSSAAACRSTPPAGRRAKVKHRAPCANSRRSRRPRNAMR